jgi:DNA modification methylase
MKPIPLLAKLIENSSQKKEIIIDLFLGSGSTLIACEQTGRVCFGMEICETYCDVIIKRWEEFSQQEAVREDGKLFRELQ